MLSAKLATLAVAAGLAQARTFTLYNNCPFTIWPAVFTGDTANGVPTGPTGFSINTYGTYQLGVPDNWTAGRFWARTECDFSKPDTQACATGSCIGGEQCTQPGIPPVTLAEFTLSQSGQDSYDVSGVDGINLPVQITANGCPSGGCNKDLNPGCPGALQYKDSAGNVVGCKSACYAYGGDHNCCTGPDNTAATCPSSGVDYYSYFHSTCPDQYAYAYDDPAGLKFCSGGHDYTITFCPP